MEEYSTLNYFSPEGGQPDGNGEHGDNKDKDMSKRKKKRTGRIVLFCILGVLTVGLAAAAIWIVPALTNPASVFEMSSMEGLSPAQTAEEVTLTLAEVETPAPEMTAEPAKAVLQEDSTPLPTAVPTATPEPTLQEQGKFDNIINIALLGIDPSDKNYVAGGGDTHTDGIVVVAVNFDKHKVDLISFPRDTFTKVPGYQGFYKINCAMDVGGEGTEKGFLTTCATLSQFLGGVPVDYYVAIDHNMVITLGDAIGGVDFDLPFSYVGHSGGKYKKGPQHLDGRGIYDYMRARKNAPNHYNTDISRTQRCREMLLAIFDKMKSEGLLTKIPDILSTVTNGVYTNLSARQIVALGNYAMGFSASDVGSYNFDGSLEMSNGWVFYFVDQNSRIEILKTVYGIDAAPIGWCSQVYATWLYNYGFKAVKYVSQAKKVLALVDNPETLDEKTKKLYEDCENAKKELESAFADASAVIEAHWHGAYDKEGRAEQTRTQEAMEDKERAVNQTTRALYTALGSPTSLKLKWEVKQWYTDPDICDVIVDMR